MANIGCPRFHRMSPMEIVQCERAINHPEDCIVTFQGRKWGVSSIGYGAHPPVDVTHDWERHKILTEWRSLHKMHLSQAVAWGILIHQQEERQAVMTNKDKALRIAFKAFKTASLGTQFSREDFSTLADLCATSLPMKHRFTRAELDALDPLKNNNLTEEESHEIFSGHRVH